MATVVERPDRVIRVTMTTPEMVDAYAKAGARQMQDVEENRRTYDGTVKQAAFNQVIGCVVEKAAAFYLEEPWDGALGDFGAPDVGRGRTGVYTRGTLNQGGDLILRPRDLKHGDSPWLLGIWSAGHVVWLLGWRWGRDVTVDRWKRQTRYGEDIWYMPQSELWPLADLKAWREEEMEDARRRAGPDAAAVQGGGGGGAER